MITCAIKLPEHDINSWLPAIAHTQRINAIETTADNLTNQQGFTDLLSRYGLKCPCAKDLLQPEISEYLIAANSKQHFNDLKNSLFNTMLCAEAMDTSLFTLSFKLDRCEFDSLEAHAAAHADFIKNLLKAPLEKRFSVAIQVRLPLPFPASREWTQALAICDAAHSKRVGLYVHFFPDEYAETKTIADFFTDCPKLPKAICFHYDTRIGETLFDDEQAEWAQRLKERDYDGLVVFAPQTNEGANCEKICETILSWADFYA